MFSEFRPERSAMAAFMMPQYSVSYAATVVELGKQGKILPQICAALGVPRSILINWAKNHPEFKYALELSQELAMAKWSDTAEAALFDPAFRSDVFAKQMNMAFPKDYQQGGGLPGMDDGDPSKADPISELAVLLESRVKKDPLESVEPAGRA